MRWRPVADRPLRGRAEAAIARLAGLLREPDPRATASLALGDAGTAVLFAYLARARFPVRGARAAARRYAERAAAAVATGELPLGLLSGSAGVAWMLQHLRGRELARADSCAGFDAALLAAVAGGALDREHDLVNGLCGIGVYALERANRALLAAVIARLAERSCARDGGAVWPARDGASVDAGTAHGAAGLVAMLGQASAAGIAGAGALHRRSARWLRAQARWTAQPSVFPAQVAPGQPAAHDCRLAWCYGDLGVACALASAAEATAQSGLRGDAVRLARRAAARSFDSSGVVDRGVCHGAAGVALGLQRLFAASGRDELRAASRRWLARSLDDELPAATLAAEADVGRGLLGAAGLALCYLAAITALRPRWASVLCMVPGARQVQGRMVGDDSHAIADRG